MALLRLIEGTRGLRFDGSTWGPRLPGKQTRQLCKRLHSSRGIALFRKKRFFYHVKLQIINALFSV